MEEQEYLQYSEDGEYAAASNRLAVERFRHPVEELEPDGTSSDYNAGFRDASKRFLYIINGALSSIIEADNPRNQSWAVAFALGSGACAGRSMNSVGDDLGIGRAALSKAAKAFGRSLDLEPSPYMKTRKAAVKYRESRIRSVRDNQERTECQN